MIVISPNTRGNIWGRTGSYNGISLFWSSQALFSAKNSAAVKRTRSFPKEFFVCFS